MEFSQPKNKSICSKKKTNKLNKKSKRGSRDDKILNSDNKNWMICQIWWKRKNKLKSKSKSTSDSIQKGLSFWVNLWWCREAKWGKESEDKFLDRQPWAVQKECEEKHARNDQSGSLKPIWNSRWPWLHWVMQKKAIQGFFFLKIDFDWNIYSVYEYLSYNSE